MLWGVGRVPPGQIGSEPGQLKGPQGAEDRTGSAPVPTGFPGIKVELGFGVQPAARAPWISALTDDRGPHPGG